VLPVGEARKPLTRAALHKIVKEVFAGAASSLRASDSNEERANRLEQASAHWLRHSAGSHMADQQVDLRLVRDNLGHASLTTTSTFTSTMIAVTVKLRKSTGSNGDVIPATGRDRATGRYRGRLRGSRPTPCGDT
jgi:site-specific recombinase XerD